MTAGCTLPKLLHKELRKHSPSEMYLFLILTDPLMMNRCADDFFSGPIRLSDVLRLVHIERIGLEWYGVDSAAPLPEGSGER